MSFKTNINRAKTKKWVQAKKNAYDGDDWGDYDEYDEYGVNQELQEPQEPQPERPAAQRYYAQRTEQPSRSFTDPSQQALHPRARKNSFDQGEEQRAFSSAMSHGQPHGDSRDPPYGYDTGGAGDFSPSAVPPPLQPRISQVPANFTPPTNTQFPPRKSSIGQGDLPIVSPPRPRNGSGSDKPLPIVRPADIYKRHQEEQERAPANIDSVLSPAQEGKSPSPSDDQDLRSVVNQAFTRVDDSRSVPPTPTSNDTSSDLLRSNTGSTSGISPIMSRVPSSAASALKTRNQAEGSTPVITEEPAEATTPVAQPTSENGEPLHHVPRKPSPAHSRNISGSSIPRSGLATPTRGDSPARSPVLAPSRDIPEPKSALFSTDDDISPEAMKGGLQGPSLEYAAREADLAASASSRPNSGVLDLGAAQRQSQNMFLESHNTQSPIEEVVAHDRSESPSKGRVQALAGKFGEVSSRRGSTQSNRSRNSLQSWEQSQNNSRAASPTKGSPPKPSSPVKEFRPHLPGQWESYTTTAMTPSEQGEQDRGLDPVDDKKTLLEKSDLTPTTAKQPVAEVSPTEADNSDPMVALKNAGAAMVDSIRTTIGINEQSSEDQQDQKQSAERGNVYLPRPLQLDRTITSDSSAPPTPPAKDTPEPQVLPSPLEEPSPASLEEDEESDRLRKEIVASLTPSKAPESPTGESSLTPLQPGSPGTNRASSIFPSEYKSYWAEEDGTSRRSSRDAEPGKQEQAPTKTVAFLPQSEDASKPIIKRFSWEASSSQLQTPDGQASEVSTPGSLKAGEEPKESSLTAERTVEQEHQPQPKGLSESPSGPVHTIMVTKPDSISDHEKPALPSPPLDLTRPLSSPSLERAYSPGLHVVNTEIDPEAVDLPPRLSADHEPPAPAPEEPKLIEKAATPEPTEHQPALEARREEPSIPAAAQEPSAKSPATDKPLGAREIATLNSTVERINTYNKTRDYWATVDHGLSDWLTAALEANPDVATQTYPVQRVPTQSIRHRHTGSLLFGKLGGSSSHDVPAEAHNDAAVPVPANIGSPTGGTSSGSGFGGRLANQHMQLKGKDLLHTANVLGGKGMTSAKGLFAKGKSRFGREKVDK